MWETLKHDGHNKTKKYTIIFFYITKDIRFTYHHIINNIQTILNKYM